MCIRDRLYNLPNNPARVAGNMGKEKSKEVEFWTKEEYLKFSEAMKDKDVSYHAFEILYWCGLRSVSYTHLDVYKRQVVK